MTSRDPHGSDGGGKAGAEVLVRSLTSAQAERKTLELVAIAGAEQQDFEPLFGALDADPPGSVDAVHDTPNMPMQVDRWHRPDALQSTQ